MAPASLNAAGPQISASLSRRSYYERKQSHHRKRRSSVRTPECNPGIGIDAGKKAYLKPRAKEYGEVRFRYTERYAGKEKKCWAEAMKPEVGRIVTIVIDIGVGPFSTKVTPTQ